MNKVIKLDHNDGYIFVHSIAAWETRDDNYQPEEPGDEGWFELVLQLIPNLLVWTIANTTEMNEVSLFPLYTKEALNLFERKFIAWLNSPVVAPVNGVFDVAYELEQANKAVGYGERWERESKSCDD